MKCPKCGAEMLGPSPIREGKIYYMWSCPNCMELVVTELPFEPWSVS